jgi:hypothetical protein
MQMARRAFVLGLPSCAAAGILLFGNRQDVDGDAEVLTTVSRDRVVQRVAGCAACTALASGDVAALSLSHSGHPPF